MKKVGSDAMDGMAEGITAAVGKLVAAATAAAKAAMNAIKTTLGIASPSRVFRDEVGAMIPAGIAQGIIGNAHLVTDAMRRAGLGAVAGSSIGGVNVARSSSSQTTFNLRITGGSDTAVGTMIQRLAQQGKLKITSNAVVGKR
jgi:phage-related protein